MKGYPSNRTSQAAQTALQGERVIIICLPGTIPETKTKLKADLEEKAGSRADYWNALSLIMFDDTNPFEDA